MSDVSQSSALQLLSPRAYRNSALFHPPPDNAMVSDRTPHLFGWKIPDILFGAEAEGSDAPLLPVQSADAGPLER